MNQNQVHGNHFTYRQGLRSRLSHAIAMTIIFFSFSAHAFQLPIDLFNEWPGVDLSYSGSRTNPYYGREFPELLRQGLNNRDLIATLREILTNKHMSLPGSPDEISSSCDRTGRTCYGHSPISYSDARRVIMGELYLAQTPNQEFGVQEVYCQKIYTRRDFKEGPYPGPGVAPNNTVINVEHTWPQSRFNSAMDKGAQKSDLHHLFPSDSKLNGIRGNYKFGEVDHPSASLRCPESKIGSVQNAGGTYFEPPSAHKGNVARALFYFSVRYQIAIDPVEEHFLRKWHEEDPIDAAEFERNTEIQKIQGTRNPFIDFPELVGAIDNL